VLHRLRPRRAMTYGIAFALILASLFGLGAMPTAHGGELRLIAGDMGDAAGVDGTIAIARFNPLAGIAVGGPGNVYVADGQTIRRISTSGAVTTLAGRAGEWGDRDGAGTSARVNNPQGLAADEVGNVYVADRDNHTIRMIAPDGMVSTVAGSAGSAGARDGKGPKARFFRPSGTKVKIEARAEQRLEREQAEHEAKMAARAEQEARTGKKTRGPPPGPPTGGVKDKDQVNLTDEDSRIMKVAGGGFDQCYNAQAVVATGSMLIVATEVTQAANDKEQLVPMIEKIQALPRELGRVKRILADSGYLSEVNVEKSEAAKIEPLIALGRSRHHVSWKQRFAAAPKAPPDSATPMQKMAHRLKTPRGRKLYALRKQTPEPVFGIIKSVMGYRQSLLRGLENVRGEWNLVTMSWNIKRMFAMQPC
jgi:hypothetical protein